MHSILAVNSKIPISCKTGQQFIDLLPAIELLTDLWSYFHWFNISHVILTSQSKDVIPILGLEGRGY